MIDPHRKSSVQVVLQILVTCLLIVAVNAVVLASGVGNFGSTELLLMVGASALVLALSIRRAIRSK